MSWEPAIQTVDRWRFGALPGPGGTTFRVFAPPPCDLRLHVLTGAAAGDYLPARQESVIREFAVDGAAAGDRYHYTLDGSGPRPDPASRFQPDGVHGPSEIVDPDSYRWRHDRWPAVDARDLVLYEVHVGAFTPQGTFAAAAAKLPALADLGVTAVQLMPVAEFAGRRNWGYDGACLFAPTRNYGRPDDLRAFVDAAHELGMAVILDVVYNHLGPEGAYLTQFNPRYILADRPTPWGAAVNLDGPGSEVVRSYIVDNAQHWVREYRLDGLRLDATHALIDGTPTHLVARIAGVLRAAVDRPVALHAEDHRNLASIVESTDRAGWGLDAIWADDFHHVMRRHLAGDRHGYYSAFDGTIDELARTIRQGWLFTGQRSRHTGQPRGTDPAHVPMCRFIVCLQNHDQVGNRAVGDRLHATIDEAAWRAASVVLLTVPMTPLIFMGQEWMAGSPFLFFTDLEPGLGASVTAGRRHEFRHFPGFADPDARARIPDPQAAATFEMSRLRWDERDTGRHQESLALYRALLRLRHGHDALRGSTGLAGDAAALDEGTLLIRRTAADSRLFIVARLSGNGEVECPTPAPATNPRVLLTTEEQRFALDPRPPQVELGANRMRIRFERPGGVIVEL